MIFRMVRSRPFFFALTVLIFIATFMLLSVPQRFVRVVAFLSDIQGEPAGEWARQTFFPIRTEDVLIAPPAFRGRIYRPAVEGRTAGLIVIPGLHPKGIEEPRFQLLAGASARQGFTVLAPDLEDFRHFQITERSIEAIVSAACYMIEQRTDIDRNKVGLFAMSYSAGPALIAASREALADKIAFIVAAGGYFHLANTIDYVLTGVYSIEGEEFVLPPHPWARMILALNNLDLLASDADRAPLAEVLRCYLQLDETGAKKWETRLSTEGHELLSLIIGPLRPQLYVRMSECGVLERVTDLADPLSPSAILTSEALKRLRARIYLLHGARDDVIPASETWQLAEALRSRNHPAHRMLITKGLTHVDSAGRSLTGYEKIIEGCRLTIFLMALLNER